MDIRHKESMDVMDSQHDVVSGHRFHGTLASGTQFALFGVVMWGSVFMLAPAPVDTSTLSSTAWQILGALTAVGGFIATAAGVLLMWTLRQMSGKIDALTRQVAELSKAVHGGDVSTATVFGDVSRLKEDCLVNRNVQSKMQETLDDQAVWNTKFNEWWKSRHEQDQKDQAIIRAITKRLEEMEKVCLSKHK